MHSIQGTPLRNAWRQILDAGGKTGVPGEKPRKQVWTGKTNAQMAPGPGIDSGPIGAYRRGRTTTLPASPTAKCPVLM